MENIRETFEKMVEEIIDNVNTWRNCCAKKYYSTIYANGIEDDDVVFDLFNDLMDGFDDVDEAVETLINVKKSKIYDKESLLDIIIEITNKYLPQKWMNDENFTEKLFDEIYFRIEGLTNPEKHIKACIDYIISEGNGKKTGIDILINETDDYKIWDYMF